MKKQVLMTPGPTPIPQRVSLAEASFLYHHRTPEFSRVFERVFPLLKQFFKTEKGKIYIIASSGTGGMEAAVVNTLSSGDKAIFAICGVFSERFYKIAKAYGIDAVPVEFEWGSPIEPEAVEKALKENPDAKAVFTIFNETSTGVYNDVKDLGEIVSKTEALLIVDGISGIGAMPFYFDEWNVDIAVAGVQKSLMMPPGLAILCVSEKAFKRIQQVKSPKFYFDLNAYEEALNRETPQTPFTPAISLIYALHEGLKMLIEEEGLENAWKRHQKLASAVREAVKTLGLELFAKSNWSNSVTAVKVPQGLTDKDIRKLMQEKSIILAGGQRKLKGKIFRIGHLGYVVDFEILATIAALEATLTQLGWNVKLGSGVAEAQKILYGFS